MIRIESVVDPLGVPVGVDPLFFVGDLGECLDVLVDLQIGNKFC